MDKRGFTLIELLIVIAIIGILAGVAVTAYIGTTKKAARSEAYSNLESLRLLEEQNFADAADYTTPTLGVAGKDQPGNIAIIQVALPGFQPGTGSNFSYQIVENFAIDTPVTNPPTWATAQDPCFTAIATGDSNTRVDGDVFAIDCNNIRNF